MAKCGGSEQNGSSNAEPTARGSGKRGRVTRISTGSDGQLHSQVLGQAYFISYKFWHVLLIKCKNNGHCYSHMMGQDITR